MPVSTATSAPPTIDLQQVPFARAGGYTCLTIAPAFWNCPGLLLRSVRMGGTTREAFRLEGIRDGVVVPTTIDATGTLLHMRDAAGGVVEACYPTPDILRLRARGGLGLRLVSLQGKPTAFRHAGGAWQINHFACRSQFLVRPLDGEVTVDAIHHVRTQDSSRPQAAPTGPWCSVELTGEGAELELEEFTSTPTTREPEGDFAVALAAAEAAWQAFAARTPQVADAEAEAATLAMYVNYGALIAPNGDAVRRSTMLMSKNWMTQCWSWDHCINAIAHAATDPDLAWDQFQVPFDHQDAHGCLPDSVCGAGVQRNFTKPPIHGWTLSLMRAANPNLLTRERAELAARQLAAWTGWWLRERDTDDDGLSEYRHGNDSGWDNGTVFDVGYPMTAPDLPAYLVLQMDEIAALQRILGDEVAAAEWTKRADALIATMIEELWTGEQFLAKQAHTGARPQRGDCLLNHIPILLGQRLPQAMRDAIATQLRPDGPFVTAHGPATESPASELFVADGYWRGPIWGPETVMVVDGLIRSGHRDAGLEVARRYCAMCRGAMTFAENYDPLTGAPLRDQAYTWGSSAFLYLSQLLAAD